MTILALAGSGVLVAVMVGIAVVGWRTLPADARIPIHYGLGSWDNFAPTSFGLVMWPAVGLLVYGVFAEMIDSAIKPDHPGSGSLLIVMPAVLVILAAAECGAITAARRNSNHP